MKRRFLIALYALLPVAGVAYHYGPGQHGVALDKVQAHMAQAAAAAKKQDFTQAKQNYDEALASLPETEKELKTKLQILKAETRMMDGEIPEAIHDLDAALQTAQAEGVSKETLNQLIAQKSTAHYYAAWLVRLENISEDEWKNQCDQARQGFRFLSEQSTKSGDSQGGEQSQKSLESSIRLAQMDLADLKALPLPKCCQNCQGDATSRLRGPRDAQKPGRKPSTQKSKEKQDGRGLGEPEDGGS